MPSLSKYMQMAVSAITDAVLPPRCIVTGEIVPAQGMMAPKAWAKLDFIAAPFCKTCGFPFDFGEGAESVCGPCLSEQPPFHTARAAVKYNDESRKMILGFKHGDQTHAVAAFAPWIKRAGQEILERADFLVPVPLHTRRLVGRRYNQAALLSYALTKETGIETLPDALTRIRHTPSQGHLKAKEREENVRKAFIINPKRSEKIKGKTVVLIDDVYTTGATVKECSAVLMRGGASAVHVLTLARVARPGHFS